MLRGHGVKFVDRDYEEIFRTVYGSVSERYFTEFISLCNTFLTLFKANGYTVNDLGPLEYKTSKWSDRGTGYIGSGQFHQPPPAGCPRPNRIAPPQDAF